MISIINPSTMEQYRKIIANLQKRWAREKGEDPMDEPWKQKPMEFCQWFIDTAASMVWSKRTYWLYRAACLWHFYTVGPIEAAQAIRETSSTLLPKVADTPATSSRKLKKLSKKMLKDLLGKLQTGKSGAEIDPFIALWLEVGIIAGLRPIEWKDASFNRETCTLSVRNAKFDAVRGNGPQRHIIFDRVLHRNEISKLLQFIEERDYHTQHSSFEALYDKCRKRLWYVGSVLWPNAVQRPSLYSTRHQFSSNMKKAGLTRAEIAALMGHRSDVTATIHYGRRVSGMEILPPSTPASEVSTVRIKSAENPSFQSFIAKN